MAAKFGPTSRSWDSSADVPGKILVRSPIIGEMASPGIDVQIKIMYKFNTAQNGKVLVP